MSNQLERDEWSFSIVERLFDHVKSLTTIQPATYYLYGHSAGGQFMHRFVMFMREARFSKAVAANAGWYTMPDQKIAFPYGLSGSRLAKACICPINPGAMMGRGCAKNAVAGSNPAAISIATR